MKNVSLIFIKIIILSFLFIFLSHPAQRPNWNIFNLNNTQLYLGLINEGNILDMDYKKIPIAFGHNEQESLNNKRDYKFLIGSIEKTQYLTKRIYFNKYIASEGWNYPVIKIVEPRIMIQDIYNKNSLFYIADREKPRIHTMPIRLEYHGNFAKIEAKKDLKKCYEFLLFHNNDIKKKTIGLLPFKIDISLVETSQLLIESLISFITRYQDSYDRIYIMVSNYDEHRYCTHFLNSFINKKK